MATTGFELSASREKCVAARPEIWPGVGAVTWPVTKVAGPGNGPPGGPSKIESNRQLIPREVFDTAVDWSWNVGVKENCVKPSGFPARSVRPFAPATTKSLRVSEDPWVCGNGRNGMTRNCLRSGDARTFDTMMSKGPASAGWTSAAFETMTKFSKAFSLETSIGFEKRTVKVDWGSTFVTGLPTEGGCGAT